MCIALVLSEATFGVEDFWGSHNFSLISVQAMRRSLFFSGCVCSGRVVLLVRRAQTITQTIVNNNSNGKKDK